MKRFGAAVPANTVSKNQSAGLLLYRRVGREPEVFLGHPGGPFWKNRDEGAWSIPKGAINEGETPIAAAKREFKEETSLARAANWFRSARPDSEVARSFTCGP